MNELEATRAKLKCLEMVEGTDLDWWKVVKYDGDIYDSPLAFNAPKETYEFAIGIVEGKPVWVGDEIYWTGNNPSKEIVDSGHNFKISKWSWNPPKPKTVMVELLVKDAEALAYGCKDFIADLQRRQNASAAVRKALEKMK